MKYIAKMMLALLASVTLVIPAYAWDFGASGSMSAKWEQSTTKASADADAITSANFSSASGGVSLKSNHTDGDKTLGLTYSVDVDTDGTQSTGASDTAGSAGLDQTLSLAGSVKVEGVGLQIVLRIIYSYFADDGLLAVCLDRLQLDRGNSLEYFYRNLL